MGVGNLKLQKPRGPRGWGIYNFETPGDPGGGGLRLSWGFPNPTTHATHGKNPKKSLISKVIKNVAKNSQSAR